MDLGKTLSDNDLLTIFVIGLFRTSRQSFASHVDIASTAEKTLDDIFSNGLIYCYGKGSNVSSVDQCHALC